MPAGGVSSIVRRLLRWAPLLLWIAAVATLLIERRRVAALATALLTLVLFAPSLRRWNRLLLVSIAISLFLHSAAVFTLADHSTSALVIAAAAVILFWRSRSLVLPDQIQALRVGLTWILLMICAIHLLVRLQGTTGTGSGGAYAARPPADAQPKSGHEEFGEFTGVILVPDLPKSKSLPRLPNPSAEPASDTDPLTIPFDGVYWFFRFPYQKPPIDAATLHGTPDDIRFRSAGRVVLRMEARQGLPRQFDSARLAKIDMAIRNTETEAAVLHAEIILSNTSLPGEPRESLGVQLIDSGEKQTLSFAVPPYPLLPEFNTLTVRIQRSGALITQSARVSIDRFVLIPRR